MLTELENRLFFELKTFPPKQETCLLLENHSQIKINSINPESGFSFLTQAIVSKRFNFIKEILENTCIDINVSHKDGNGTIPFIFAYQLAENASEKYTILEFIGVIKKIVNHATFNHTGIIEKDPNKYLSLFIDLKKPEIVIEYLSQNTISLDLQKKLLDKAKNSNLTELVTLLNFMSPIKHNAESPVYGHINDPENLVSDQKAVKSNSKKPHL